MGREVRRVPLGWEHPKVYRGNGQHDYQPMYDSCVEEAWQNWLSSWEKWTGGEHQEVIANYSAKDYPLDEPYRSFCQYHGQPPDPAYYRPDWTEEELNGFAIYETVTEGTPVTPTFATREELIEYLVAHGDFWDQSRGHAGWSRAAATRLVMETGYAPSIVVIDGQVFSGPEGMAKWRDQQSHEPKGGGHE